MFAVIKTGGKQYRVAADDVLKIEKLDGEPGDIIQIGNVLAVGEGEDVTFGAPFVDGATVAAEVVEQGRGPKVIAFKKRRRQNSRRKRGHRQLLTTVRISEILTGGAKPSKKAAAKPAAKAEDKADAPKKAAAPKKASPKAEAAAQPLFSAPAGEGDDLTKIKGIGPVAAGQLKEQGIATFAQIAALSDDDVARIDEAMPFSAEQISDWREQAKELTK
ncbi:50S ribosomal protein L21 [Nitratireductor basaltis]|uniref:Large ribosomal subunit protein bL21 n=1 Tax=Nitratireductor basaltis TaxID=472175 RepID=A0A084U6I6_9HYPH|nr:50S ribosomal protein L21 [Nitratireductor basaltis]KFB08572.1 50S ribosomal protein L21 [Nitratireductor basaltis]